MTGIYEQLKDRISGDAKFAKMFDTVKNAIDDQGLDKVLEKFKSSGLGEKVQSWISKGENRELAADEVKSALGTELDTIAQKAGVTKDEAAEGIANTFPEVVDKLTPDGVVPSDDEVKSQLASTRS